MVKVRGLSAGGKLVNIIHTDRLVLFMKGTPAFPLCGLSAHVCFWLKKCDLHFRGMDVLQDPELHIFLRELHAPTAAPYLYADGKFVGGYEEIKNMFYKDQLRKVLTGK